jgi:large subunit ribosomal protein L24e
MPLCSFCGTKILENEGLMYVQNDGKIRWYCSSKCEKNVKLGRIPRKTTWVRKKMERLERKKAEAKA